MKDKVPSAHADLIKLYEKTREEFNGSLLKLDAETALADIYESMNAEEWHLNTSIFKRPGAQGSLF